MTNILIDITIGLFLVILVFVTIVVIKNITKGFSHHHYWYVDGIQTPTDPHNYQDYYQSYYKKRVQSYSDTQPTDSKRS